ncbi:hypothetical protein GOODEAATRI_011951 [Goodea atripinnis]|uniref:Uncharacterized protein n=1 Tax=Goodea atripinnis TaxID=208336 RepID=A0ABV0N0M6_9TELE
MQSGVPRCDSSGCNHIADIEDEDTSSPCTVLSEWRYSMAASVQTCSDRKKVLSPVLKDFYVNFKLYLKPGSKVKHAILKSRSTSAARIA